MWKEWLRTFISQWKRSIYPCRHRNPIRRSLLLKFVNWRSVSARQNGAYRNNGQKPADNRIRSKKNMRLLYLEQKQNHWFYCRRICSLEERTILKLFWTISTYLIWAPPSHVHDLKNRPKISDYLLPRVFIFIKCCIFSEDYQSLSLIRLLLELTFFSVSREHAGLRLTQMLLQLQVL